jgi:hypothetical protein
MGGSKNEPPILPSARPEPHKQLREEDPEKGRRQVRARRQEDPAEENPPEENYVFTPVESPYYQNGDESARAHSARKL